MPRWSDHLARAVHRLDHGLDRVRYRLAERYDQDELVAASYLGYGTRERLLVRGRVLEVRAIEPAREDASLWQNLLDAYRRFDSDEVPLARLELRFGRDTCTVVTDQEGYFSAWFELSDALPADHSYLQQVELELLAPLRARQQRTRFPATVVVPSDGAAFGVVSDVDDTVLQTGANNLLTMVRRVLFGNARTRLPYPGVDAFYRALHRDLNPIFYVSSSPWNLYDLLLEFFDLNGIPPGPLQLRDWGTTPSELLPTRHSDHKLEAIEAILGTYPGLPFLLIGDSGQQDPEIYTEVVRRHRGRIRAIYIRDVGGAPERGARTGALAERAAAYGVELLLVPDTVTAARHAAGRGFIEPAAVAAIESACVDPPGVGEV